MKKMKGILISIIFFTLVIIFTSNFLVYFNSKGKTFDNLDLIEKRDVGLLLGTSKYMRNGESNPYYENRLDAVKSLFDKNKINKILVSGDNQYKEYNEPVSMQIDLIERGVPEDVIFLDYAGFRTLDSVVRANKVFAVDQMTIISQEFHNKRALLIANLNGIDAIAFNAEDPDPFKALPLREFLARIKLFIDIFTWNEPKFLGDKIPLEK